MVNCCVVSRVHCYAPHPVINKSNEQSSNNSFSHCLTGTSVSAHDWDTGTPLKLSDFKGDLAPLNDAKGFTVTRVFRRVKVARTNKDGSFQRDADNNIKYSTREYNQFHQFELNMEEATGADGKPLVIEDSAWGAYESGGILTQLKTPQTVRRHRC